MKQGAATTSEGVLANFFNSLLSKKTGGLAGGQPGPVGPGASPGGGPPGNYIIYLSVPALALHSVVNFKVIDHSLNSM